jgi:hypothetical protein
MGNHVDQEMANSQRGTDLEAKAARHSHYMEWSRIIGIPDPCGPNVGYQRIVAMYVKYLQSRVNYYKKNNLHSATLRGYAMVINTLLELQQYRPPINFNDNNNMVGVFIINIIKEENIAKNNLTLIVPSLPKSNNWLATSTTQTQIAASLLI